MAWGPCGTKNPKTYCWPAPTFLSSPPNIRCACAGQRMPEFAKTLYRLLLKMEREAHRHWKQRHSPLTATHSRVRDRAHVGFASSPLETPELQQPTVPVCSVRGINIWAKHVPSRGRSHNVNRCKIRFKRAGGRACSSRAKSCFYVIMSLTFIETPDPKHCKQFSTLSYSWRQSRFESFRWDFKQRYIELKGPKAPLLS